MCSILVALCSRARIPSFSAPRVLRFGCVGADVLGPDHQFKCHTLIRRYVAETRTWDWHASAANPCSVPSYQVRPRGLLLATVRAGQTMATQEEYAARTAANMLYSERCCGGTEADLRRLQCHSEPWRRQPCSAHSMADTPHPHASLSRSGWNWLRYFSAIHTVQWMRDTITESISLQSSMVDEAEPTNAERVECYDVQWTEKEEETFCAKSRLPPHKVPHDHHKLW